MDANITLIGLPNDRQDALTRGGVAVSTRHGNAVRRNRLKRLCREGLRLTRSELPPSWDFMVLPRYGVELTLEGVRESLVRLAWRMAGRGGEGLGR